MQIGRKIEYTKGWEDLKVQIYFWSENMFYPVVVSKVEEAFCQTDGNEQKLNGKEPSHVQNRDWVGIISHITNALKGKNLLSKIPLKYRKFSRCGAATRS